MKPFNFEKRKGRKIVVNGTQWKWTCSRGTVSLESRFIQPRNMMRLNIFLDN